MCCSHISFLFVLLVSVWGLFLFVFTFFVFFFFVCFLNPKWSQRSALKFWGCCSGAAPSLFCKGWWHKRKRGRDKEKRKNGSQDEIAPHLLMCHRISVFRDLDRDPMSGRAVYFVPCFPSDFFDLPLLCNYLTR